MASRELVNFTNIDTSKEKYHQDIPKHKFKLAIHRSLMALRWRPALLHPLGVQKTIDKE
jgi:hypothetical protein